MAATAPTQGQKAKGSDHCWNRADLQKMHDSGMSDAEIAAEFDASELSVAFARKRESWWRATYPDSVAIVDQMVETTEEKADAPTGAEALPEKKKPGRPPKNPE